MAQTYDAIASYTFASAASSYTFSSIAASWTDLIVIFNGYCGADYYTMRFNSDSSTNYSRTYLYAQVPNAYSARGTNDTQIYGTSGDSSTNLGTSIHHIMNYANVTTYKTVLRRGSMYGTYSPQTEVGIWRKTPEAITSITFTAGSGNFGSGTTITIYGIKAA